MTYYEQYNSLITTAKARNWTKTSATCYAESHHIIPRCLNGNNSRTNLVVLTAQEHYEAHRLLALANPKHPGLSFAWWNMCHRKGIKIAADEYALLREIISETVSAIRNSPAGKLRNAKISATKQNKSSDEIKLWKSKLSESAKLAYANMPNEAKLRKSEQARTNNIKRLQSLSTEQKQEISNKISLALKERYEKLPLPEKEKYKQRGKQQHAKLTAEEKQLLSSKNSAGQRQYRASMTTKEKRQHSVNKTRFTYNTPYGVFELISDIQAHCNITPQAIRNRFNSNNFPLWIKTIKH